MNTVWPTQAVLVACLYVNVLTNAFAYFKNIYSTAAAAAVAAKTTAVTV